MGVDGWMNVGQCFVENNVKAFYGMLMKNWVILGISGLITCFKHNIGGEGYNYMFNILCFNVWCVIDYKCYSITLHL
jgi:hypothetical protein